MKGLEHHCHHDVLTFKKNRISGERRGQRQIVDSILTALEVTREAVFESLAKAAFKKIAIKRPPTKTLSKV